MLTKQVDQWTIKTMFIQKIKKLNIYILKNQNLGSTHTNTLPSQLRSTHEQLLSLINDALPPDDLFKKLPAPPVKPLFNVR